MIPPIFQTQVASSTPFDPTTGKGFYTPTTDVQLALEELRDHTIFTSQTQATTAAGTLTLTNANTNLQYLTGTAVGYNVQLPSALTLSLSAFYQLINTSSQTVQIKDGGGNNLFVLGQNSIGFLYLQLNGTAAGTWTTWQTGINVASGIISYNVNSTTPFSSSAAVDTLITGMSVVPQAGTYAIWYNGQNTATGSGQQSDITIYNGASPIVDSARSNLSTAGTHVYQNSTQTIASFNGTNACSARIDPNGNSITVGARSLLLIRLGT